MALKALSGCGVLNFQSYSFCQSISHTVTFVYKRDGNIPLLPDTLRTIFPLIPGATIVPLELYNEFSYIVRFVFPVCSMLGFTYFYYNDPQKATRKSQWHKTIYIYFTHCCRLVSWVLSSRWLHVSLNCSKSAEWASVPGGGGSYRIG